MKILLLTALLPLSLPVALSQPADPQPKPYAMKNTAEWTMTSSYETEYRIMVSVPDGEAPANGFPIVYLLDGDELFPVTTSVLHLQAGTEKLMKHNGIAPGIVVAIGYPDQSLRDYDYTPPAEPTQTPETYRNGRPYPERPAGGADRFLDFIQSELKPVIEERYPVDRQQQALMGNGFGGLFALHTLFTKPELFQTYVAASPSIWWNSRYILTEEASFAHNPSPARLFLTVGENEQSLTKVEAAWPVHEREEHRLKITRRSMVDSTRELYWRLSKIEQPNFEVTFESFPGESHKSVIPMSISHSLPILFPPQKTD